METIHAALESYPWLSDSQFMLGLMSIHQKCDQLKYDAATKSTLVEEAKLFYFQKQVMQFDIAEYKQWRAGRAAPASAAGHVTSEVYEEFERHDFDKDEGFQSGLQVVVRDLVQKGITGSHFAEEVRKVKLYYFSRIKNLTKPLDYVAHKTWVNQRHTEEMKASGPACPYGYTSKDAGTEPLMEKENHCARSLEGLTCPYGFSSKDSGEKESGGGCDPGVLIFPESFSTLMEKLSIHFDQLKSAEDQGLDQWRRKGLELSQSLDKLAEAKANSLMLFSPGGDSNVDDCVVSELPSRLGLQGTFNAEDLERDLSDVEKIVSMGKKTALITVSDGGSMPLAVFLAGGVRVVTHRSAIRVPRLAIGCSNAFYGLVSKATSPSVALYLALTRKKIYASDILYVGLGTHFVPASKMPTFMMIAGKAVACPPPHTLMAVNKSLTALTDYAGPSRLQTFRAEIEKHFTNITSFEDLFKALEGEDSNWAKDTLSLLKGSSLLELKVTQALFTKIAENSAEWARAASITLAKRASEIVGAAKGAELRKAESFFE